MNNNYIKCIGLLVILPLLLIAGCKKLEQLPESTATQGAVFNSEKGLELYAYSFYDILPDANTIHRSDAMSDYAARTQAPDFIVKGAYSPRQSGGWSWSGLRNINYFIENTQKSSVSPEIKNHYLGLARFFRAWFYFDKVKNFGDVPWINKTMAVDDPALFNGRDSRTLVMDSIIADLDFAIKNMKPGTDNSRSLITRNVAYAFKSRVCLFEGTFRKYQTQYNLAGSSAALLTQAAEAAQKVMDEGGYSLNNTGGPAKSYRQLFISQQPVTSEIILAAVADPQLSVFNDANWWWTSATYGARVSFTRTFINTYLNIDGSPFTGNTSYKTTTFAQEVKNRDMRLQQSIRMGDYKRINGGVAEAAPPIFSYTYTGYQPIKFTLDDTYNDGGTRNTNSLPIMRYAEILLNYAEAKAELGSLTDADWAKTVGALRRRAGITGNTTLKPVHVDPYLVANYFPGISDPSTLEIRRERGIELALEGFRFHDLIRWKRGELMQQEWNGFYVPALNVPLDLNEDGKNDVLFYKVRPANTLAGVTYINVAETISSGVNPQRLSNDTFGELTWLNNVPRKFEEKNYLYPIPEADLQMNPKLGQNPGW